MIKTLCSLTFDFTTDYERNLKRLSELVSECDADSFIVAPEVTCSGFDYEHMDKASAFSATMLQTLLPLTINKTLIYTAIEKREEGYYNFAKVLHNGALVYEQAKAKLFTFGGEHHHFVEGDTEAIQIFEIEGIKIAILICFELRFKDLWKQIEGADIIAVPAFWGKNRAKHFVTLSSALAIMNQCYVIATDATSSETGGECGIISAFGNEIRDGSQPLLKQKFIQREIVKMRRYMDVGII